MQGAGRQYSGVVDAYRSIWRLEGVAGGLYRGTLPNIARNCIINVGETGATHHTAVLSITISTYLHSCV